MVQPDGPARFLALPRQRVVARAQLGAGGDDLDPLLARRVPPDAVPVQRVGRDR